IELPRSGSVLSFSKHSRSMRVPWVVFADFESFIKPIDTCQQGPRVSYRNKYQQHTPSSVCYYIKCFYDSLYLHEPTMFTADDEDDNAARVFIDSLEEEIREIYNRFKFAKKMIFTKEDAKNYNAATTCHICGGELGEDKVRDHCHLRGNVRGAAHKECNLNYKIPTLFPVVFHNLTGYDIHLFIKKLRGEMDEKINYIPCNEEKYISF